MTAAQVPVKTLISITTAEDELRFDKTLADLLAAKDERVRARAALAAGRIGNDSAIAPLAGLLENDKDSNVRATAAFAIGEIESIIGADVILKILGAVVVPDEVRARAVEAAGRIAAANVKEEKAKQLGAAIIAALESEDLRGSGKQSRLTVLLGITAALRAKPESADVAVAKFLANPDARIRADAANTLARLRAKNSNEKFRSMLQTDADPIVRANAARGLGAGEDKESTDLLITTATTDSDLRVRVNAIRSLGNLKDQKSADRLLESADNLFTAYKKSKFANPTEKNELLEILEAFSLKGLCEEITNHALCGAVLDFHLLGLHAVMYKKIPDVDVTGSVPT